MTKQSETIKKTASSAGSAVPAGSSHRLKVLTTAKYWRQVASNLFKNLGLMVYLVVIYFAINLSWGALIHLQQSIWPVEQRYALLYNQFLHFVVFGSVILGLWAVPKLLLSKHQLGKSLEFNKSRLGLTGWLKWREIGLAVSGFVLAFVLRIVMLLAVKELIPGFDIEQKQDLGFNFGWQNSRLELVAVFFTLVVLAPVVEELIFRGFMYEKVRERSGFVMTALLVSVLFGLAHFMGGGWVAVVVTFSLSLVMCLTREVSGSIYPAMIIHAINNGLAFWAILSGLK